MNFMDSPRWLVLQITERCNLRCHMCYEWGDNGVYRNNDCYHDLPINKIEEIFSDLKPYKTQYELFGGEPLMHPDFEAIVELINQYDCPISIPTNGTLISKYEKIISESKINNLWVSLDGPKDYNDAQRGKGVYDLALNGLYSLAQRKQLNNKGPALGVTMVVTPLNYHTIKEFFCNHLDFKMVDKISIEMQLFLTKEANDEFRKLLKTRFNILNSNMSDGLVRELPNFSTVDVKELCTTTTVNLAACLAKNGKKVIGYPKYFTPENIDLFYNARWNEMKEAKRSCGVPLIYAEIGADGFVTPCHTFYEFKLGNIYESSILDIWKNKTYLEQRIKLSKNILPICYACSRYFD